MAGPSSDDLYGPLISQLAGTELRTVALAKSRMVKVPKGFIPAISHLPLSTSLGRKRVEREHGVPIVNGKPVRHGYEPEELLLSGVLDLIDCHPSTLTNEIHPLFQQDNFDDCPEDIYTQLRPGLQLATKFLTTPACLQYWVTSVYGKREKDVANSEKHKEHRSRIRLEVPLTTSNTDQFVKASLTWRHLLHVTFGSDLFVSTKGIVFASQTPITQISTQMFDLNTSRQSLHSLPFFDRSLIKFHSDFYIAASKFATLKHPKVEQVLRFNFWVAINLLHETAHTIEHTFDSEKNSSEAYLGDLQICEAGYSWETYLFGGKIEPINGKISCVDGLSVSDWIEPPSNPEGPDPQTYSAIPMTYVQAIQEASFWEQEHDINNPQFLHIARSGPHSSWVNSFSTLSHEDLLLHETDELIQEYLCGLEQPPTKKRMVDRNGSAVIKKFTTGHELIRQRDGPLSRSPSEPTFSEIGESEFSSESEIEVSVSHRPTSRRVPTFGRPLTGPARWVLPACITG